MQIDLTNPWQLIPSMLVTHPSAVAAIPIFAPHAPDSTLILRARRHSQRIPPELAARIVQSQAEAFGGVDVTAGSRQLPTHIDVGRLLLTIPADLADELRGPVSGRPVVYLVLVQREAYDQAARMAETGIVLPGPGPVNGNGQFRGIVKP